MNLDPVSCRRLFDTAKVMRLSTSGPDGPHIVPVVMARIGQDTLVSMVDHKPKRSHDLRRLRNIADDPRCAVLADHYEDDWSRLWWVRADAVAAVDTDESRRREATASLTQRYAQYVGHPPAGPLLTFEVTRWSGWAMSEPVTVESIRATAAVVATAMRTAGHDVAARRIDEALAEPGLVGAERLLVVREALVATTAVWRTLPAPLPGEIADTLSDAKRLAAQ